MKTLRRRTNTSKMWFQHVAAKINDASEIDAELEVPNTSFFHIHYLDDRLSNICYTVDCVLLAENQVDLIHIMHRGKTIIQLRFASPKAKEKFLEEAFRNRNEDSGNSSPVSNQASMPSPPP